MTAAPRVVYLSGGVGGARLAYGMARVLPAQSLCIVVNTGDDFRHWGLSISPDLDTVMYTLAGLGDVARGWGLSGETFAAFEMMRSYGAEDWFALGDRDLATHLMRSQWLGEGVRLTEITARLARALGVEAVLLPMSDAPRETMFDTDAGTRSFQRWLVHERAAADVRKVWFRGATTPTREVLDALEQANLVVIGPSNPYVSIDPITSLDGVRERIEDKLCVGVSPIVQGKAVKGPLARMLETLAGHAPSPAAIASHYRSMLKGLVVEGGDEAGKRGSPDIVIHGASTIMSTRDRSVELAREVLAFAEGLRT